MDRIWNALDGSTAAELLAGELSAANGAGLEPVGRGDFCFAFRSGTRVYRVARHPEAARALRREACVLPQIAGALPVPVPRPVLAEPTSAPPFAVHEMIGGEALTRELWLDLEAAAREAAATDLARFLAALHALPPEVGLACGVVPLNEHEMARELGSGAADPVLALLDAKSRETLEAALARWARPTPRESHRVVLLHGDVSPGHLLFDPGTGRLTGVIDFGDLAIGDPARDFIYVYEDYGSEILEAVLDRYADGNAASFLPEIRKWYLLDALARSAKRLDSGGSADVDRALAGIRGTLGASGRDDG